MKKILISIIFIFIFAFSSVAHSKNNSASIPNFKAISNINAVKKWHKKNEFWYFQNKKSPYSPRILQAITGPRFKVFSFSGAFKDMQSAVHIKVKHRPKFERLEAYKKWDGTDLRISLTPTTYSGVDGVLFLLISKPAKDKNYHMIALEMTAKTYKAWGGVARILQIRGILKSLSGIPRKKLAQIANAPLSRQVKFYEAAVNTLQGKMQQQLVTLSQMQTLQLLQNFHFDMIQNIPLTDQFEY